MKLEILWVLIFRQLLYYFSRIWEFGSYPYNINNVVTKLKGFHLKLYILWVLKINDDAGQVGIQDVMAEVMPAGKADVVRSFQKDGSVVVAPQTLKGLKHEKDISKYL